MNLLRLRRIFFSCLLIAAPAFAQVLAVVEFHADVQPDVQQSVAAAEGVTFQRPAVLLPNHAIVSASMDQLKALAAHDEVAYIFPADPALLAAPTPGVAPVQCAGMLTVSGPIAQYANVVTGWDLDSDRTAHLGYVFGNLTSKVPASAVESEILRAMSAWSAVTNVVFHLGSSPGAARTIFVEFASGAHGDSYPFDTAGTVAAHTFYPVPLNSESIAGDVHLDASENWHVGGDIDIYTVVLHELGHAIGLTHSDNPGDVMYPYYQRGMQLSANDIGAARMLYGSPNSAAAAAPVVAPVSVAPVTVTPTTVAPTTVAPTTVAPTTVAPTTVAPTTVAPTTVAPTTVAPVTPAAPLSLTLNPITPQGQVAQTAIAGTVSGGVGLVTVQYQTDHGYTGKAEVSSSGIWSAGGVTLVTGTNNVTVTAFDSANHTASQTSAVTRTATAPSAGATTPMSVVITSPASAVSTATGATISVGGTASGGAGITQVTWQTSTGASGIAVGTDPWLATNIPVLVGTNTILVRAFDATGASAWASVVVVHNQ